MGPGRDNSIPVALIGAAAVIIAALIGYYATHRSNSTLVAYTGKVKDGKSLKPVGNASVAITEDQKVPQRFTTDSEGVFFAQLAKDAQTMLLEVKAEGYKNYSRRGPTVRTGSEDIFLEPLADPKSDESPKPLTWCDHSPAGAPYQYTLDFWPHEHLNGKTEGGDLVNPGAGWYIEWQAPGPVYNVSFRHDGTHMDPLECGAVLGRETVAFCHGWKNGGNFMGHMFVQWKQPCQ